MLKRRDDLVICAQCGHTGTGKLMRPGSGIVEFFLLLLFCLPGLLYALWRNGARYYACGACGIKDPVLVSTPAGQKLWRVYNPGSAPPTFGT